ncbi:hypothetical protein THF1C08_260019 [Vibrio jasicida]|jgi:hypothetical protein|uniref:Uncharacterized protein n=1 Tax=Vibrio jasicida TaxID=766224 RepID=A0AAU9QPC4_9VIBR|nr:hypothetical protein THF1C08_260019 [Vibrio jasicida]CAH1596474.1 hypothetical protein THF1A12_300003 [Vibrio jasicida]
MALQSSQQNNVQQSTSKSKIIGFDIIVHAIDKFGNVAIIIILVAEL